MRSLNEGQNQPALERLRKDFPSLADATTNYALGDVWARPVLDDQSRQIAAAFAALGAKPFMKIHAGYACKMVFVIEAQSDRL